MLEIIPQPLDIDTYCIRRVLRTQKGGLKEIPKIGQHKEIQNITQKRQKQC